jgi:nicotinate-nucleotide adenylyltransferase
MKTKTMSVESYLSRPDPFDIRTLSGKVKKTFENNFGQTPLRQRCEDILGEAIELSRFTTIANLKEEHGDLLSTLLMSFIENGWDPVECIEATLKKIERRTAQYKAFGRKLNVAILGSACDPIHLGHVALAEFILNFSSEFDMVWIMPCFKHMYGKQMASAKHRLEMCRLATKHDRRIQVFDYEIKNKLGGETYHLAKQLMAEDFAKNKFDFSLVIGGDNAATFDKWVNYQDLEKMIRFVVIPRQGVDLKTKNAWFLKSPHMLLTPEVPIQNVSSTMVRTNLKEMYSGRNPGYALDFLNKQINTEVLEYIRKNNLYKEIVK